MIDLHVHTTHSDGRLSPTEAVQEATARGLCAIAITDHDVLSGLEEATSAGERLGIEVVPGIEMSARWDGHRAIHVLGYFVDPTDAALNAAVERARRLMERHVTAVLREIRAAGGSLEAQDLDRYRHRYAGGAALVLGMLERGVLKTSAPGTAMRLLRLAAAEPSAYSVQEAIALIHGAGGVASLAHPSRLKRGRPLLSAAELEPLVRAGLDAIEAWQWVPNGWGSEHYRGLATDLGLSVSGGSDDHGKRARDGSLRLGTQQIPAEVLEALRERALSKRQTPRSG